MWRIVYENDVNRVLLLGGKSHGDCIAFLNHYGLCENNYLIQRVI